MLLHFIKFKRLIFQHKKRVFEVKLSFLSLNIYIQNNDNIRL